MNSLLRSSRTAVSKTKLANSSAVRKRKAFSSDKDEPVTLSPNKKRVKLEMDMHDPSSDNENCEDEESDYEERRLKNIRLNADFLAKIGIDQAKLSLSASVNKPNPPSRRGLKPVRVPAEILPRRSSLRLQNKTPEGLELPPEYLINKASYTPYEPEEHPRVPSGPLGMKECLFKSSTEEDHNCLIKTCKDIETKPFQERSVSLDRTIKTFQKLKLTEKQVAKVVPERTFSVAIHPTESMILVATGDKWGKLGIWNVQAGEGSSSDGVCCYFPHSRPVNCVEFPVDQSEKVYSCSYDGTLRCGDLNKEIFDELYSVPEDDDILLRNFGFTSAHTLVVSRGDGSVAAVDTRTDGCRAENVYQLQERSLRTVSVHPIQKQYITTSCRDGTVCVWDLRNLKKVKNKPLASHSHSKSVSSAYFSPVTGQYILTTSADDRITILDSTDLSNGMKVKHSIRHNNFTGRWISPFRARWHPSREDLFVCGSMNRPRQVELFSGDGKIVHAYQDEENLKSICSLNVFHPTRPIIVGANSSGRLHVFM